MSEQLTFDRLLSRREFVLGMAERRADSFCDDFLPWLGANYKVWERFESQANLVYGRGRQHYSARTIGEYLRHESALSAVGDGEWKLNNNRWPDLARLYLAIYPEREGFFELRESPQRRVAA